MASEELLNYIRQELQAGKKINDIEVELVTSGWSGEDIQEALRELGFNIETESHSNASSKSPESPSQSSFPSIAVLFRESWNLFKATLVPYLKISLLVPAVIVPPFAVIGLAAFLINKNSPETLGLLVNSNPLWWIAIIALLLFVLAFLLFVFIFVVPISQIAAFFILETSGKLTIRELIKKSKPLIVPFLLTSALVSLVVFGGIFALVIPGILFSILFMFVPYIVILENQKGRNALRRSYSLVKPYFWPIFLRSIIVFIVVFAISFVFQIIASEQPIAIILSFIINFLITWFSLCYTFVLYKQVKSLNFYETPLRIRWIGIVAGIGLIIALLFLIALPFTLIAINPAKQFSQANNTKRQSDVTQIYNAMEAYAGDHEGQIPSSITTSPQKINKEEADICAILVPQYTAVLPVDPAIESAAPIGDCETNYNTGYTVAISTDGSIKISAPNAELNEEISSN